MIGAARIGLSFGKRIFFRTRLNRLCAIFVCAIVAGLKQECDGCAFVPFLGGPQSVNWRQLDTKLAPMPRRSFEHIVVFEPSVEIQMCQSFQGRDNCCGGNLERPQVRASSWTYKGPSRTVAEVWEIPISRHFCCHCHPAAMVDSTYAPRSPTILPSKIENKFALWPKGKLRLGDLLAGEVNKRSLNITKGRFCYSCRAICSVCRFSGGIISSYEKVHLDGGNYNQGSGKGPKPPSVIGYSIIGRFWRSPWGGAAFGAVATGGLLLLIWLSIGSDNQSGRENRDRKQ